MKTLSTVELIEKAQAGDREALGALIKRYRLRLEALVHVRLGAQLRKEVDVADVCQETWLKVVASIGQFRCHKKNSFFPWLGGVAEHVIQNLARRTRKTTSASSGLEELLADDGTSPSDALQRKERFERLERALDSLSEDHKKVIVLARLRGLSRKEIGQMMNRSEDAVSMLLYRALGQLGKHFGHTDSYGLPPSSLGGAV